MSSKFKMSMIALSSAMILLLSGCTATQSTIKEYGADGKITRETTTSESVIKNVADSLKTKTVVVWENGWAAYVSISTATQEDPTPTGKLFAGKVAKGYISLLPGSDITVVPAVIQATREELSVTSGGITATAPGVKNE
ncbi:MAG: hypothetical protein RRY34_08130 [Victivallaceae bacterium]